MSKIKIGPSGVGPVKDIINNLERFSKVGISAAEITFTYSVYINKEDAVKIKEAADKFGIKLSIHAPYYINLNSDDEKKLSASKQRIIKCCEIGHLIGARQIVIHSGFYSKKSPEETYENIKKSIIELQEIIKKNGWDVELAPEVMGKVNVFGSIEEISKLARETGCSFTIDFAHVLARYKKPMLEEIIEAFPQKKWHCHFSGIEYSDKGERKHIDTEVSDWKNLLDRLKKLDKEINIINESPNPFEDAVIGIGVLG